jgi:hypothetical protein
MTAYLSRRRASVLAGFVLLVFGTALAPLSLAQTPIGPRTSEPPSYGGSAHPQLAGYELREVAPYGMALFFIVSVSDLQNFLPTGYSPVPIPTDTLHASIQCNLIFHKQLVLTSPVGGFAPGTYGPYNSAEFFVVVNGPSGPEGMLLTTLVDNTEIVDRLNALRGPNSSRFSDINFEVHERAGEFVMHARVEDPDVGLLLKATITGVPEITTQTRDFGAFIFRFVNSAVSPPTTNAASWVSLWNDASPFSTAGHLELSIKTKKKGVPSLSFSGGTLGIAGMGDQVELFWNGETLYKLK